jgi:hypothetical protein
MRCRELRAEEDDKQPNVQRVCASEKNKKEKRKKISSNCPTEKDHGIIKHTMGLFGCWLICLSLKLASCLRLGGQIERLN